MEVYKINELTNTMEIAAVFFVFNCFAGVNVERAFTEQPDVPPHYREGRYMACGSATAQLHNLLINI